MINSQNTRNHAETINLLISNVLEESGYTINDIAGIAVCGGPGSYTGLRIGLATAKGICYAANISLFLHNRLSLLAYQVFSGLQPQQVFDNICVILFARDGEYFVTGYNSMFKCILQPTHFTDIQLNEYIDGLSNCILSIDCPDRIPELLLQKTLLIDTNTVLNHESWAKFVEENFECNKSVNLFDSEPLYLKGVYTHK